MLDIGGVSNKNYHLCLTFLVVKKIKSPGLFEIQSLGSMDFEVDLKQNDTKTKRTFDFIFLSV